MRSATVPSPGSDQVRNDRLFGQDKRQSTRPEGVHELPGARIEGGDVWRNRVFIPNMDNQRVKLGAVLGGKDCGNRLLVQRIRTQAVDGFRREGHDLSGPEPFGRRAKSSVGRCRQEYEASHEELEVEDWGFNP